MFSQIFGQKNQNQNVNNTFFVFKIKINSIIVEIFT